MNTSLKRVLTPWLLGLVGGAVAIVATSRALDWPLLKTGTKVNVPVVVNDTPIARDTKMATSYSSVVKKAAPSVVNISSAKYIRMPDRRGPMYADPFFRYFFGDEYDQPSRRPRTQKQYGLGSGVIISKDGYLITNNHVVDGADEIKITLASGKKTYDGKVVGRDAKTDIAVVKIDANDLPVATLTDSDKVEVGDVVLAIGSPFGLAQTVTMGIVSATGRSGMGIEEYEDFIQTDAAINPGNSGGALVDAEGRVAGINTAIMSRSGGNQGVGFAVPINMARHIMQQILEHGKVDRGQLGIWMQDLNPALARQFKAPEGKGVLVAQVVEDSAAAQAGIKTGDVVVEFNGKAVTASDQLKNVVGQLRPGEPATVKVLRDGREKSFEVSLKAAKDIGDSEGNENVESSRGEGDEDALPGVVVTDITPAARNQLRLPPNLKGALVTQVEDGTAAAEKDLREGDVIVEINRKPIRSADDAVAATQGLKNKEVLLRVYSRGGYRYISVDESAKKR